MNPFGHGLDPFGGAVDPMEQVLSLQTYEANEVAPAPCVFTNGCRICGGSTFSCDTLGCSFSCPLPPGAIDAEAVEAW